MPPRTLNEVVAEHPFPDYRDWWPMQSVFLDFISEGVTSQWADLHHNDGDLVTVKTYVADYVRTVYETESRPSLVDDFVARTYSEPIRSGEFDALSYAFYRSAFELIEEYHECYGHTQKTERRLFAKRVGTVFFDRLRNYLGVKLPDGLDHKSEFDQLMTSIQSVGQFLIVQGYLRDHFRFSFAVGVEHAGNKITQTESDFLSDLHDKGMAYAVYEMGYPAILPSAVYLYHTLGEAQHHSSRTIEEIFDKIGYVARETDDFNPSEYPSDMVVELWEIRDPTSTEQGRPQ